MPRDADFKQTLCADIQGFSLHAAVRCSADDRQALEQLCRYITHPALQAAPGQWPGSSSGTNSPLDCLCPGSALAIERVQTNAAWQVVLKLKTPWRDGTTHLVLRRNTDSPVDCLCQPKGPSSARARPARLSPLEFMPRLAALVPRPRLHLIRLVPQEPEPPVRAAPPAECEATCAHHRPVRLSWAKLLKRVLAAT